ncbi:MAG TPA: phosphorylase [Myxococcota bacterium]
MAGILPLDVLAAPVCRRGIRVGGGHARRYHLSVRPSNPQRGARHDPSLEPGSLWPRLLERQQAALARGALHPIETSAEVVEDAGVPFLVRWITGPESQRKFCAPQGPAAENRNPFLPYDADLFVADVSDTHFCLLSKFPAVAHHTLLVTREFEEQMDPLTPRDWEALCVCMQEFDALAFYNSGAAAGASQRHRHIQIVPPPVGAGPERAPIEALLDEARFDAAVGILERLPFLHALAKLRADAPRTPGETAGALYALYCEMLRAFGCEDGRRPYNLLLTRDWMLFVPRTREQWESISVNALGFAGALLVRDPGELARVRAVGPMQVLRHVGVSRG